MSGGKAIEKTKQYQVIKQKSDQKISETLELIKEERLLIRIEGELYSVIMRTPGDEVFHAAGFCLGEGIILTWQDIASIKYDEKIDKNLVDVWLTKGCKERIGDILQFKKFFNEANEWIFDKEIIIKSRQALTPALDGFEISSELALDSMSKLSKNQELYHITRGSHAALIFNTKLEIIAFAEDVGRHNALDKVIGKALIDQTLEEAKLVIMSSRIACELIHKAARAKIPMMIANSRPTSLAVDVAKNLNMTLAFPTKEWELMVVCGGHRIRD